MTFQGALFDLDGLILDTEAVGLDAFVEIMGPLGMSSRDASDFYLGLIGISFEDTRTQLQTRFPGVDVDAIDCAWVGAMGKRLENSVPLRPTAFEAITDMHASGLPMAVVTSSGRRYAISKLKRVGLLSCFRAVVTADDVTRKKPDPEPYLTGAKRLIVPAAACAAFEDSDTGTRAARAAGCATWQIPDLRPAGHPLPALGQSVSTTLRDALEDAGLL